MRLRGTIESFQPPQLVIKERSGESVTLRYPEGMRAVEVVPTDVAGIQPGAFIGTAAVPRPDGTLEALEVVVFPEEARGSGEGHFPWDLKPESTMTNATVATMVKTPQGRTLTLKYKDGEKKVVVPVGVPVVTLRPGDRSLLAKGNKVFIVAEDLPEVHRMMTALALVLGIKLEGYLISERSRLSVAHAKETVNLGVAGMLHDIGKTKLPRPLQTRHVASADPVEPAQQREWEEHTRLGYEMIQSGVEATAASAVLHHHQRFDGSGFPKMDIDGQKQPPAGKRIHIFARILGAAELSGQLLEEVEVHVHALVSRAVEGPGCGIGHAAA